MIYTGHVLYRLLAGLSLLLALLFAWQLWNRWDWGALLFLGVALWTAWRCIKIMTSRIEVTADRVRLLSLGEGLREVEFRQFSAVYEEGRALKSILLLYHPRAKNGLVAHDEERSLALPAVNQHEELLAALSAQVRP